MAMTESTMLALGTVAPRFELAQPATGKSLSRDQLVKPRGLLIIFMCNHCPFVKHILPGLKQFIGDYNQSDIGMAAISANDADNYPEDSPQNIAREELGCPYLYDESQQVAKAFAAVCTPEFYLFDGELKLVYRGQFDDSRPGNGIPVSGRDLRAAVDALLAGKEISEDQRPGVGCNIKWKVSA